MVEFPVLGYLRFGEAVVDRPNSHLHVDARAALPEALARIECRGRQFIEEEIVFSGPVGMTQCVTTDGTSYIGFARRPGRTGLSRFVVEREPEPTSILTVVIRKEDEGERYILVTAHVGERSLEPWDPRADEQWLRYWAVHALILGGEQKALCWQCEREDARLVCYYVLICRECDNDLLGRYKGKKPPRAYKYVAGWGKIYYPCWLG